MFHHRNLTAAVVLLVGWLTGPAGATLIGDDVTLTVTSIGGGTTFFGPTAAVGSTTTTEWDNIFPGFQPNANLFADIVDDDTIKISLEVFVNVGQGANLDWLFTGLDWGGTGTVAGIGPITTAGVTSFTSVTVMSPTSVFVSGLRTHIGAGDTEASITFDLIPNHANGVPEPLAATLGVMGLGVLGMATRRRRA